MLEFRLPLEAWLMVYEIISFFLLSADGLKEIIMEFSKAITLYFGPSL